MPGFWKANKYSIVSGIKNASGAFMTASFFTIVHTAADVIWPYLLSETLSANQSVENENTEDEINDAYIKGLSFVGVLTVSLVTYYAKNNAITRVSSTVAEKYSSDVNKKLLRLNETKGSEITANVRDGIDHITHALFLTIPSAFEILLDFGAIIRYYDWMYLSILPITIFIAGLNALLSYHYVAKHPEHSSKAQEYATAEIQKIIVDRRAHNNSITDDAAMNAINEHLLKAKKTFIEAKTRNDKIMALHGLITGIGIGAVVMVTSALIQNANTDYQMDDLLYIITYILAISNQLYGFGDTLKDVKMAAAQLESGIEILEIQDEEAPLLAAEDDTPTYNQFR